MWQIAEKTLIAKIERKADFQPEIVIDPELIVRTSAGHAPMLFDHGMAPSSGQNALPEVNRLFPRLERAKRTRTP